MKVIWKYILYKGRQETEIILTKGARCILAKFQMNDLCVWYMTDPNAEKEIRRITLYATGTEVPNSGYINTVFLKENVLQELHLFEEIIQKV